MPFERKVGGRRIPGEVGVDLTRLIISSRTQADAMVAHALAPHADNEVNKFIQEGEKYFRNELRSSERNQRAYVEALKKADKVHIMVGCCDARVGVPYSAQQNEMYVYLPFIGGGDPGDRSLVAVTTQLMYFGVPNYKIDVIVAQHGTTKEIQDAAQGLDTEQCDCVECGLRIFRRDNKVALDRIANEKDAGIRHEMAQEFSKAIGGKITPNLILIAASRNWSGNIIHNMARVFSMARQHVKIPVYGGLFDHKKRQLHVLTPDDWGKGWKTEKKINFPGEHREAGQDPVAITIAVGPQASTLHNAVFLPNLVGQVGMKNDFSAAAPSGKMEQIKDAISQASYAAGNYVDALHGNVHGKSFQNLQSCVFLCDDSAQVLEAKKVVNSSWFLEYYRNKFLPLHAIYFVDVSSKEVSSINLHRQQKWS